MYHTNTWGTRHSEQLAYLAQAVAQKFILAPDKPLNILEIGPGAVPIELAKLYSQKPSRSAIARVVGSTQRRFYSGKMHTYEPVELLAAFKSIPEFAHVPINLTVIDISGDVLAAVPDAVGQSPYKPSELHLIQADIQKELPSALQRNQFDAVWGGVLFPHLKDRQAAYENITALTAPGGLLSITRAESFSTIKWILRGLVGRLNEDFASEIDRQNTLGLEREIANPQSSYQDVLDLAGRTHFDIISGKYPLYQKKYD